MGYGMKYTKGGFPFKQDKKTGHASTTQERFNDAGDEIGFATQDKDGKSQHGPTKENLRILNAEKDEKKYGSQIKNNNNNTTKIFGNSPAPFKPKGMTGLTKQQKKNKRAKFSSDVKSFATGKKKALELKQGEHNSKEFQAKVEKILNLEMKVELFHSIQEKAMSLLTTISKIPLYSTKQEALDWAKENGKKGLHVHMYEGETGFMGGVDHETVIDGFESAPLTPLPIPVPVPTPVVAPVVTVAPTPRTPIRRAAPARSSSTGSSSYSGGGGGGY